MVDIKNISPYISSCLYVLQEHNIVYNLVPVKAPFRSQSALFLKAGCIRPSPSNVSFPIALSRERRSVGRFKKKKLKKKKKAENRNIDKLIHK